jgi:hypothetical protein
VKENCIVTVGIGNWYPKGIERLRNSLEGRFDGDFVSFTDYLPGWPNHNIVPYAFKPYAFEEMRSRGYKNVMWMDASFWAIKNLDTIFNIIDRRGYIMIDAGHNVGTWTSDEVLKDFQIDRDFAMTIPMFIAGGFGLNFECDIGNAFLDKWLSKSQDGHSFMGSWDNNMKDVSKDPRCHGHRHDMSVGSLLAADLNMSFFPNNMFMAYYEWYEKYKTDPNYNTDSIALLLQGM